MLIDLFSRGYCIKTKKFCTSSLAVKNLTTSLDVQKQSFLFSGESTWPPRDKGLLGTPSRSNWDLDVLVFEERGKLKYPEKNLSKQGQEPTTNSTHI